MSNGNAPETLEDFETCPMCGFEGITTGGCCVNCGETLIEQAVPVLHPADDRSPYWRLATGGPLALSFAILTVAAIFKSAEYSGRDRQAFLLYATALCCVALIGLTMFARGVGILMRRSD